MNLSYIFPFKTSSKKIMLVYTKYILYTCKLALLTVMNFLCHIYVKGKLSSNGLKKGKKLYYTKRLFA